MDPSARERPLARVYRVKNVAQNSRNPLTSSTGLHVHRALFLRDLFLCVCEWQRAMARVSTPVCICVVVGG